MTRRNHSLGLKLFIFFLVAMMLFSAIGVMVIYLRTPTPTTQPTPDTDPTAITLPDAIPPSSGEIATGTDNQEAPLGEVSDVISGSESGTGVTAPTPGIPVEPTPAT